MSMASMGCLQVTAQKLGSDAGPAAMAMDASARVDASNAPDAHFDVDAAVDAGVASAQDASMAPDSGPDAASGPDSGPDAASGPDSGPDASVPQGHCSPSGWCWEYPRPHGDSIMGIWGPADAGGLFATTSGGRVLEQTATGWKVVATMESGAGRIHGSGPKDIWVAGTEGACQSLHFDGTAWRVVEPPPLAPGEMSGGNCFTTFWALAPNDVLGGVDPFIGRPQFFTWDGQTWNAGESWESGMSHWHFAGSGRSELIAAQGSGWLAWTPGGWESREYGTFWFNWMTAVWTDGVERWFVGRDWGEPSSVRQVLRQDAAGNWSQVAEWSSLGRLAGDGIAGASRTDLYLSSPEGLKHWNGTSLAAVPAPFPDAITALWWDPRSGLLWAGGSGGSIASWNGSAWTSTSPESQVFGALRGLWCDGVEPVAVGDGQILARVAHGWRVEWTGAERLHAVWGPANESTGWAVGDAGLVLRRQGDHWLKVETGTQADLRAIWGAGVTDVWAGGAAGTLLRFDGTTWSKVASPTQATILALWGSSKTDVWLAAEDGVWRLGPTGWDSTLSGEGCSGTAVLWGTGPDNLWLANGCSGVLHWDGTAWTWPNSDYLFGFLFAARAVAGAGSDVLLGVSIANQARCLARWDGTSWSWESVATTNPRALCVSPRGEMWMVGGAVGSTEPPDSYITLRIPAAILHKPAPK